MSGLSPRLTCKIQITTDGLHAYKPAIANYFDVETNSDYAQIVKIYGDVKGEGKYSPGDCTGVQVKVCCCNPDPAHINTSFVERHNLTIRMTNRRFTRLTNGHSKKLTNHSYAIALNFVHYNFCRVHSTLRVTPAMEAGLTDHVWEIEELIALLD